MSAYYNEIDPFPAQWLRNLCAAGRIAPGHVDNRSLTEVTSNDLQGFTQAHFFAGIGVWSYALRCAGWPDDREIWTASLPCQPWSTAGAGGGENDERHLWPVFFRLVCECRPRVIVGEQVSSNDGLRWFDIVSADLESAGYAVATLDLCAAGVGAPHIRQRLYWMAYSISDDRRAGFQPDKPPALGIIKPADGGGAGGLSDTACERREGERLQHVEREKDPQTGRGCEAGRMEHSGSVGRKGRLSGRQDTQRETVDGSPRCDGATPDALPVGGFWRDAVWMPFRDGKLRPIKPGIAPLVNGAPARVGRLRAYGNAIVAPLATLFIQSVIQALDDLGVK